MNGYFGNTNGKGNKGKVSPKKGKTYNYAKFHKSWEYITKRYPKDEVLQVLLDGDFIKSVNRKTKYGTTITYFKFTNKKYRYKNVIWYNQKQVVTLNIKILDYLLKNKKGL